SVATSAAVPAARTSLRNSRFIVSLQSVSKIRRSQQYIVVPGYNGWFPSLRINPTERSIMISVHGVSMRFGSKVLFDDVTTTFSSGRRYGLTGPNGAGKSTFMKLLTGELPPQQGTVVKPDKLGVLRQDQYAFDEFRVIDTVIMGNHRLWDAL